LRNGKLITGLDTVYEMIRCSASSPEFCTSGGSKGWETPCVSQGSRRRWDQSRPRESSRTPEVPLAVRSRLSFFQPRAGRLPGGGRIG